MSETSRFYNRLNRLIKNSNKAFNEVERELGYPRNSLSNYKYGALPSANRLIELAHYFGVTPEYLAGKSAERERNSVETFFASLSDEQKEIMCNLCYKWLLTR